jgi:hypothetical protein
LVSNPSAAASPCSGSRLLAVTGDRRPLAEIPRDASRRRCERPWLLTTGGDPQPPLNGERRAEEKVPAARRRKSTRAKLEQACPGAARAARTLDQLLSCPDTECAPGLTPDRAPAPKPRPSAAASAASEEKSRGAPPSRRGTSQNPKRRDAPQIRHSGGTAAKKPGIPGRAVMGHEPREGTRSLPRPPKVECGADTSRG